MAENTESSLIRETLLQLNFVLGENTAVLRESKETLKENNKILHKHNNLKQAELESLQDKKMCFKVLDRLADLIEKRPVIMYIILIGLFAKIGVDIYGLIKALVEGVKFS